MKKKLIILMSGGVDSSVAAFLAQKMGYNIIGIHFKTIPDEIFTKIPEKKKICCSPSDTYDAMRIANKLGFELKIIKIYEKFKEKIIHYFINEYKSGYTPNPCMLCNKYFKFGLSVDLLKEYDADYIASGHYVIREFSQKYNTDILRKGIDISKDQSYFLGYIDKKVLPKLIFPNGSYTKDEIRKIAENLDLNIAKKVDSQELCFIPDNDYRRFLKDNNIKISKGAVLDLDGNIIGEHSGYTNYTIGQRTGITYFKNPNIKMHVYKILPEKNQIIVAPTEKVYFKGLIATNFNFLVDFNEIYARCRIRKRNEEKDAYIKKIGNNKVQVIFKDPIFAVTPGQFAVVYDNDGIILGAGKIEKYLEV
ncbi:tRNA-specific 2-thiouridylase [Marinitoga hydrogenitolerans DSM 16785]|uniref:tRNA-specific 2-thiouridylase MnmA n=1 Tax=Marinitoga hydrogenitolerans (strain DSM 16785 / JCM 12826 / AT1271) TaxID=1122195 RepID=A0A1M4YR88_MARH1|nr:tRNA 2-thiouridine(34) synthase MnmA [Marinitoga hydrogenitolerans]SHF08198.1 tRNA-specific 2-thiouridylase [Marinitoga hydrogenitolerans DSM 16785]